MFACKPPDFEKPVSMIMNRAPDGCHVVSLIEKSINYQICLSYE